jgi:hypothetical protein
MATLKNYDREAEFIRLVLVILGMLLTIAGWLRFAGV